MKLHQLLAVAKTRRRDADGNVNGAYHIIQKHQLFVGMTRTYQPKDDAGLRLPEESQLVQANVADQLSTLRDALATLFDTQASIDVTNTFARADVVVDGVTLVAHGRASTYDNWGCRCDECRVAGSETLRRRRRHRLARNE